MLSRTASAAVRASACTQARVAALSAQSSILTFRRFNSTKEGKTSRKSSKPFYDAYSKFLKSQKLNEHGEYITMRPTEADYENSALAQHLKKINSEKDTLIEEKLKALAESNGVTYEEVKNAFEAKVAAKEAAIRNEADTVNKKIEQFLSQLALPLQGSNDLVSELLDGLLPFSENIYESEAFKYIYEVDPKFAQSFSNLIRTEPTQELVNEMSKNLKNGPISRLSEEQLTELKQLLAEGKSAVPEAAAAEDEVNGQAVLETIFSNLNSYENINSSPLLKLIENIDPEFSTLLKSYSSVDPADEEALNAKYQEIFEYCSAKESKIYKAFGDAQSPDFTKLKEVLEQPLPIDLSELYEVFEFYPDYFKCDLFKTIEGIDPHFGKLLNELETLPEGEELDKKNDEIDAYLSNDNTPIYKAMNDINAESFQVLRSTLDAEWEIMSTTVTPDRIIEYVIRNGLESDGYKLISKIDPTFAEYTKKLYSEQDDTASMEIYQQLQEYLEQPNDIVGALEDKQSLNYKLLSEVVFKPEEEETPIVEETPAVKETPAEQSVDEAFLSELTKEQEPVLSAEVQKMNEVYDLTIEAIDELESDLKKNTFVPASRVISQKMDKLLGFQPTTEQVTLAETLKERPLPQQTDEVLELAVNIIMKDGKKETARRNLNRALYLLFLETRSNPVEKLKQALDIVAPIVVTKTVKTGFAKNYTVPAPLTQRQRNRMALLWILSASDSKASNDFPVRLCDEILHVLSGKSSLIEKRVLSHKLAIANRSYLSI